MLITHVQRTWEQCRTQVASHGCKQKGCLLQQGAASTYFLFSVFRFSKTAKCSCSRVMKRIALRCWCDPVISMESNSPPRTVIDRVRVCTAPAPPPQPSCQTGLRPELLGSSHYPHPTKSPPNSSDKLGIHSVFRRFSTHPTKHTFWSE